MSNVTALTIYAIRREVDGKQVKNFDTAISSTKLEDSEIDTHDYVADDGSWEARLYLWPGKLRPPGWLSFLESGFDTELTLPESAQSSAVIVVRVKFRRDRYYAVTFGGGRYCLRRDAIYQRYGLQVALNAIYKGDENASMLESAPRVQQVNTRTVNANTMRMLRQSNRSTDFDYFELDLDRDQLDGITGYPKDDSLGRRLRGTDSLRIGRNSTFNELGAICRDIARYHEKKDYQRRFSFVDNVTMETNAGLIASLSEKTVTSLLQDPDTWVVAPPGLVDFDQVAKFEIPELNLSGLELSATELSTALANEKITTAEELAELHVIARDGADEMVQSWPVFSCLDGQIVFTRQTYLADGGQFYRVSADYLEELDDYIRAIPPSNVILPESVRVVVLNKEGKEELKEITEGEYNEIAADSNKDYLLLDKELVRVTAKTSPVEVCDILTSSGQLVHVKRKFSSSSLSHLFAQGFVSSELLVASDEYRTAIRKKIGASNPNFQALFPDGEVVSSNFEIVYAIVADWGGKSLTDIPCFSKINLRKYRQALRRIQFQVTYVAVPVVNPT